jgi:hypothetical protein
VSHFDDANHLVQHAREQLAQIQQAYNASLSETEIKPNLLIEIKNFMENLRSGLDFVAHGLFSRHGSSKTSRVQVYFPYSPLNQSRKEFQSSRRVDSCIPGISNSRPDIVAKIEAYQHFAAPNNRWLPLFMDLNNTNKHQQLTPQVRREAKELKISSDGSSMSVGPGAIISIGHGASVRIGGLVIPGGQSFGLNSPPVTTGRGNKEIVTWVSFHFSANDEPVLPLLRQALEGTDGIIRELSAI